LALFELTDTRREILRQFLRFGMIGTAGVFVDGTALYIAMHGLGLDHYSGRLLSWLVAATFTWSMNRRFTFEDKRPPFVQWMKFLAANAVGGLVNYGVYGLLVYFSPIVAAYPIIGVGAGSIAGLFFNFTASKWMVFKKADEG
jgi:putative flippase GtrA